ncbi:2-phosphosulfolactate phosphatase [Bulleidia sp. zg-1006]|uniref:2-phosphosulfolactate phosphatase n=1 Tax=Bulleidia sp. zg-1006 TaxID=2806552 RepID=UPI001EEE3F90|nr:2-phosphosulfolactate phosphatase [Bulleidia sp. zg-1006]
MIVEVQILPLLQGAKEATGLAVIIDVFRAFSLEAYMQDKGAKVIFPVQKIEDAFGLKKRYPEAILVGERNGIKVAGFDYGNSPSELIYQDLRDKIIIHTTSAGVQGLINAKKADEIVTGALVNAKATVSYIQQKNHRHVSIVPMGWNGERMSEEDNLCANYLLALLKGEDYPSLEEEIQALKQSEGKKFFDSTMPQFPQEDFALCTNVNYFQGVNKAIWKDNQYQMVWEKMS